jgi:hypothetical protein
MIGKGTAVRSMALWMALEIKLTFNMRDHAQKLRGGLIQRISYYDRGHRDRPFVSANLIKTVALGLKGTCVSLNTVGRGY